MFKVFFSKLALSKQNICKVDMRLNMLNIMGKIIKRLNFAKTEFLYKLNWLIF